MEGVATALGREERVEALFLGGSFGRGTADEFSDLDYVGLTGHGDHDAVVALWRETIEAISPVVFWNQRVGPPTLLNAITRDWLRIDLWLIDKASFLSHARPPFDRYSQSTLLRVVDRGDVFAELPESPPGAAPEKRQVEYVINEFIRVLGLIAVGVGRREYVLGVTGAGLLRDLLTRLMIEETLSPERGGALHLSRTITPAQMDELLALPYPSPVREEVLEAHWALARTFFPRARALADRLGIAWPEAFEQATKRHLQRSFGAEMEPW